MYCEKCGQQLSDEAVFCSMCGSKSGNAAGVPKQKTREDWMLDAIKEKILKMLKSPGTAVFSSFYNIDHDDYGRTYAEIAVDSQNAFGATLRTKIGTVFKDVADDACPSIVWGPILVSFISPAKIIKSVGNFGRPF